MEKESRYNPLYFLPISPPRENGDRFTVKNICRKPLGPTRNSCPKPKLALFVHVYTP